MKSKTNPKTSSASAKVDPVRDADWDTRLGFLIHDVSRLRRNAFDEVMKPEGLTRSQWWILANISRNDGMIQSELAGVLDLGKAALGQLLDRLEASAFIERRPNPEDRRVKHVYLTKAGARMIGDMRSKSDEMSERFLQGLSVRRRQELANSLLLIKNNLLQIKSESGTPR